MEGVCVGRRGPEEDTIVSYPRISKDRVRCHRHFGRCKNLDALLAIQYIFADLWSVEKRGSFSDFGKSRRSLIEFISCSDRVKNTFHYVEFRSAYA